MECNRMQYAGRAVSEGEGNALGGAASAFSVAYVYPENALRCLLRLYSWTLRMFTNHVLCVCRYYNQNSLFASILGQ